MQFYFCCRAASLLKAVEPLYSESVKTQQFLEELPNTVKVLESLSDIVENEGVQELLGWLGNSATYTVELSVIPPYVIRIFHFVNSRSPLFVILSQLLHVTMLRAVCITLTVGIGSFRWSIGL